MTDPFELWDLLFREYASPLVFLDEVIPRGLFVKFLDTFEKKHEEKLRWEFYLHKLGAFDNRSWVEFNHDIDFGTAKGLTRPSDEEITDIVRDSYGMMSDFKIEEGEGGE